MAKSLKLLRLAASYVVPAVMLILFGYGAARFYDGPISECGSGYCSTRHQSHTAEDYRAYKAWEKTIFIVWPLGLAAIFFLRRGKGDS
jgi:hypothetical protein